MKAKGVNFMSITNTANRIVNYGVVGMLCSILALQVISSDMQEFSQTLHMRTSVENAHSNSSMAIRKDSEKTRLGSEAQIEHAKIEMTRTPVAPKKNNEDKPKVENFDPVAWLDETRLNDPDFHKLSTYIVSENFDRYYKDLYKVLALDDTTCETLRELLAEKSSTVDAASVDEKISALLGQDKFAQLCEYELILPERNKINEYRSKLEFSDDPLTVAQETELLPVLENYFTNDPRATVRREPRSRAHVIATASSISSADMDMNVFKGILTPRQMEILTGFQNRDSNWCSVYYPWHSIGDQMREQGAKRRQ